MRGAESWGGAALGAAVVGAVLVSMILLDQRVEAAPCSTEGAVGEVLVPGLGSTDVDTGDNASGSACVGTTDGSVQVFEAGLDVPGYYTDTAVKVCASLPGDPVCTYDSDIPRVYAGVANEDVLAVHTTSDGIAVAFAQGTSWDTLVVGVLTQPSTGIDVPRVCVEGGSARCEDARPVLP